MPSSVSTAASSVTSHSGYGFGPAVAFWQAVGRVEGLDGRQGSAPPDALGAGRLVVVETLLTAAVAGFSVVRGGKVVHG
jgi:hypothetical protein